MNLDLLVDTLKALLALSLRLSEKYPASHGRSAYDTLSPVHWKKS